MTLIVYLLLAQYAFAAAAALQPDPAQDTSLSKPVIGQIVLFLTTVAGFAYTIYRENRNRRWDLEDRERARAALAETVTDSQKALAKTVQGQQMKLIEKIDENTELTVTAIDSAEKTYREANDLNQKLAKITEMFTGAAKVSDERLTRLETEEGKKQDTP
jgi:hypothetical protein